MISEEDVDENVPTEELCNERWFDLDFDETESLSFSSSELLSDSVSSIRSYSFYLY